MTFSELAYIQWAKSIAPPRINLARSGVDACPPSVLKLRAKDLVTTLPVRYGYAPLRHALAKRYDVAFEQVFTVSGGTSFANWLACVTALDGAPRGAEVLVERPTYEPLLRIPESLGYRVRRLDRTFATGYAIDLDRFAAMVGPKTKLAIVSNLHNPSGARIDRATLSAMSSILRRVGARLLVDEVYLECLWGARTESCVHAGPNVIVTNSLTKAYGLDGLRAGWILGPAAFVERAALIHDVMANNGVAPGEAMALAALKRLPAVRRRVTAVLEPNLEQMRRFFARETRLSAFVPEGGNVVFPRLPPGLEGVTFAEHLREHYDTQVVPGHFFEAPRHVRISYGCQPSRLRRGLRNISRALDDLGARSDRTVARG